MSRKIIQIDEQKCVGCGLCANACKQSAIEMVDGKAKVVRDDYCDGLGNCLPVCPVGAISFSDRDIKNKGTEQEKLPCGCPGTHSKVIEHKEEVVRTKEPSFSPSQLNQWPVQIKLVPVNAPYFENANLLVAADCTAFAYGNFHSEFMKNKITIIGCPKLDEGDYADKLTDILMANNIKSVTVIRMEVPCCGGIENAVKTALINSKKMIPWQVVTISVDGKIIE
ncbi:MAG: 4Fe-4S binding protein [Angelakisella sp.]